MGRFNLSIMDRYIFKELISPFIFSVAMFSFVGVAIATLSDLVNKITESNLPLISAIEIFFLTIPEYLAYALPFSVLLTSLISYSRLSKDSELIALQSCGISLYRLVTPALIFSLIITCITFAFNELIVPQSNFRATQILVEKLDQNNKYLITQDIFYPQYKQIEMGNGEIKRELKSIFYAQEFNGQQMQNITIIETNNNQLQKVIVSEVGFWDEQTDNWDFSNGATYDIKMDLSQIQREFFDNRQINLPKTPLELASKSKSPHEMNIRESLEYIELLKAVGNETNISMYKVRTAQKISFPFICLIFGLIGSTLGSQFNNNNKGTSFGLTVIIVFSYYLMSFFIGSLGIVNLLTPTMAAWIPNIICLTIGIYLLKKSQFT